MTPDYPFLLTEFLSLTAFGLAMAVIATAYYQFVQPGMVLAWWAEWVTGLFERAMRRLAENSTDCRCMASFWQQYDWILKPILTCVTCIAGQLALWLYLFTMPFNWLGMVYVICLSAYAATWLKNALEQ